MTEKQNDLPNPQIQPKFLPDTPLTGESEQADRFGHAGIADSLRQIISTCPVPFTIGLFGSWGTGKTSILNLLKEKLTTNHKIPTVSFDVWKHEGDALRRTFLTEMVEQLKKQDVLKNFELSERVKKSIGIKKTIEKIDGLTCGVFIGLIVIMFTIGFFLWPNKNLFNPYFSVATSGSLVTILLMWLFNRIIVTENITSTAERFEDPHEFEKEFQRIINTIKSKSDRVLIALDNVDRCTHKKAVELLSTIKTFLAQDQRTNKIDKCIFLIPCDDAAIKKHLQSVYNINNIKSGDGTNNNQSFNADEFLRKFFNAYIILPEFIDTDLHRFTETLLSETDLPQFKSTNSPNLAFVITTAFRDNPRQIKQFINILLSHFLMAQNREQGEDALISVSGTITENVEFLAKFLIIRQEFSKAYKQITREQLCPEEWEQIDEKDFKNFHITTNMITTDNIRPFIYLKQSPEELQIPNLQNIKRSLIESNTEVALEEMKFLKESPEKNDYFNLFLLTLLRRNRFVPVSLINIFKTTLAVSYEYKHEFSKRFYTHFGHILNDSTGLKEAISRFKPSLIFNEVLSRLDSKDRNPIVNQYVTYFSWPKANDPDGTIYSDPETKSNTIGRDYAYDLLKEFINHSDWLTDKQKATIGEAIERDYYNDSELLSLFQDDTQIQTDFITEETLSKFISTFSDEELKSMDIITEKVALLLKFKTIITSKTIESLLTRLNVLLTIENNIPFKDLEEIRLPKANLLRLIEDILSELVGEIANDNIQTQLNTLADNFHMGATKTDKFEDTNLFIPSCFLISNLLDDEKNPNINSLMEKFFVNANLETMKIVFENKRFSHIEQAKLINQYPVIFNQRALNDQLVFDYLYKLASKEVRTIWLVNLIDSHPKRAVKKIESLKYKTDNNKKIVEKLLKRVATLVVAGNFPIYKTINEMKCANSTEHKNELTTQIKALLTASDIQQQELGYQTLSDARLFLNDDNKRDIARSVVEWLRSFSPENAGQIHSWKSVTLLWDDLLDRLKTDYTALLFDKLILPWRSLDNMKLGVQILSIIKAQRSDYPTYYNDTKAKVESEPNEAQKIAILEVFSQLKPNTASMNKSDKNFWKSIATPLSDNQVN